MEKTFVSWVWHFWVGFKPILKNCMFFIVFEAFFHKHGPQTKIAFPNLKERSNQKVNENKLALKLNFTLNNRWGGSSNSSLSIKYWYHRALIYVGTIVKRSTASKLTDQHWSNNIKCQHCIHWQRAESMSTRSCLSGSKMQCQCDCEQVKTDILSASEEMSAWKSHSWITIWIGGGRCDKMDANLKYLQHVWYVLIRRGCQVGRHVEMAHVHIQDRFALKLLAS